MNWQDFLGDISGYRPLYLKTLKELEDVKGAAKYLREQLDEAKETIRQLELLVPRPAPPALDYVVEKDTLWIQERLDSMELSIIRLPMDGNYRLTNQDNFFNIVAWDTTDRIEYVRDYFDCDKFAMLFKVMVNLIFNITQVGFVIDYKSGHAYNLVLFPNGIIKVFEPQSDGWYLWTKRVEKFYNLKGAVCII